jgi:hypothetical protein
MPPEHRRGKLNLTVHPDILEWANTIGSKRRRSISQLFEELVEAEWLRQQAAIPNPPMHAQMPQPPAPHYFYPPPPQASHGPQ